MPRSKKPFCRSYLRFPPIHMAHLVQSMTIVGECQAYGLPQVKAIRTPTIVIPSLGGGVSTADIADNFGAIGLPKPNFTFNTSAGGKNAPGNAADTENMLDIVAAAGVCSYMTGQQTNVIMVGGENTDEGLLSVVELMLKLNGDSNSSSWGADEGSYGSVAALQPYENVLSQYKSPFFAAAGDDGSTDGTGTQNVDYFASSRYVIGVGGTQLQTTNIPPSVLGWLSENVWNDGNLGGATGGGPSHYFARPSFQDGFTSSAQRCVPDIAANASPMTGLKLIVGGRQGSVGGTSWAAPFWAGVAAAIASTQAGPVTNFLQKLYAAQQSCFRDITSGNNGEYSAGPGYDECTGRGTPTAALVSYFLGNNVSTGTGNPPPNQQPPTQQPPANNPPPPPANNPPVYPPWQVVRQVIAAMLSAGAPELSIIDDLPLIEEAALAGWSAEKILAALAGSSNAIRIQGRWLTRTGTDRFSERSIAGKISDSIKSALKAAGISPKQLLGVVPVIISDLQKGAAPAQIIVDLLQNLGLAKAA